MTETPPNYGQPAEIKTTNIRLPHDLWYAAKLRGLETGESLNALIIRALTEHLQSVAKPTI